MARQRDALLRKGGKVWLVGLPLRLLHENAECVVSVASKGNTNVVAAVCSRKKVDREKRESERVCVRVDTLARHRARELTREKQFGCWNGGRNHVAGAADGPDRTTPPTGGARRKTYSSLDHTTRRSSRSRTRTRRTCDTMRCEATTTGTVHTEVDVGVYSKK